MADPIASLRSMLTRTVTIDEALEPYLGISPLEADKDADADETSDGFSRERLHGLVTILALHEAPPQHAALAAAVLWRSAPVAFKADELRTAMRAVCEWRSGLDGDDVARIAAAHRTYERAHADLAAYTGRTDGPEFDELLSDLVEESRGDHVAVQLGDCLVIVEMTATDYFVGIQDDGGTTIVIDRVPIGGGRWDPDLEDPAGPRPLILIDA